MIERLMNIIKVIILAIVEGVSEWLPISSSGHMLLLDEFIKLDMDNSFKELFFVVIQLGAIMAVLVLFFKNIFPFKIEKRNLSLKKDIMSLWMKIIIACIPGAIVTLLFDDYIERYLHTSFIISLMLIVYGMIFILIENINEKRSFKINNINKLSYKTALLIGVFQCLSIIPGTSRSGATIIGGILLGIDRSVISEFSFYLAIPVMFGFSLLKLFEFGFVFTFEELMLLIIAASVSFVVSLLIIRFLLEYIKKHNFKIFGYYRIILGVGLLVYFII